MKTEEEIRSLIIDIESKRDSGSYKLSLGEFTIRLDTLRWVLNEQSLKEDNK